MTPDKLKLFMHAILKLLLQNLRKMPEEQALFATSIAFWETVTIEQLKDALARYRANTFTVETDRKRESPRSVELLYESSVSLSSAGSTVIYFLFHSAARNFAVTINR